MEDIKAEGGEGSSSAKQLRKHRDGKMAAEKMQQMRKIHVE
jgi:hypothetical protein